MMSEPQVSEFDDRFEVMIDNEKAGFVSFLDRNDQRVFIHTQIESSWGGRGVGSALLNDALHITVGEGKRIVPVCDFVAGYADRHEEFTGHVDKVTPEITKLIRRAQR